jgi:hypothetical protein
VSRPAATRPAATREEGQATVELALALPLVVTLALLVAQVAVLARDELLVVHAARVAAREAAVDPRPAAVHEAAVRSAPALKPDGLSTETSHQGWQPTMVIVSVTYRAPTDVPIVGRLLPDIRLEAKAAMRDETARAPENQRQEAGEEAGTASWTVESCVSKARQAVTGSPDRTS